MFVRSSKWFFNVIPQVRKNQGGSIFHFQKCVGQYTILRSSVSDPKFFCKNSFRVRVELVTIFVSTAIWSEVETLQSYDSVVEAQH